MADDSVVRPARRIIKIKFGNTVLVPQSVRITGAGSSASQDSKDTKSGSALHLAKLRQASLKGYVPPSASAEAIVARLREGEGFAPGDELPAWDFTALPARAADERPSKRFRQAAFADGGCLEPSTSALGHVEVAAGPRTELSAPTSRRVEAIPDAKPVVTKPEKATERTLPAAAGSGESNSDQATNSHAYLPLSPEDAADANGRVAGVVTLHRHVSSGGQSSLASSAQGCTQPSQRSRPPAASVSLAAASSSGMAAVTQARERCTTAAGPRSLPCRPAAAPCSPAAARPDPSQPSTSGRQPLPASPAAAPPRVPAGVSAETQTAHRDFPVLPTSFLELPRLSGTALAYQSIGPFDLQLEHEHRPVLPEGGVDAHIDQARKTKREGDALFQKNNKVWNIKSLSKYVIASLMFMEAAEAMLREKASSRHSRAAGLYRQTADLLGFTLTFTDSIRSSNGIGKEALRLLAERLCAICLMRQAALMAHSFKACADKAQAALREHQRQQQQQAAQGQGAAGSHGGGPLPSPGDSSTSSLPHAAGHGGGATAAGASAAGGGAGHSAAAAGGGTQSLAGFGPEQVAELIGYARTTCKFAEQMKRSSKSFEAFLERADVRQDQQAKLVCMHLAAVCMDVGMSPGLRVIHHAREAVRTLCEDLAR